MTVANTWNYRNELTYTALKTAGVKKAITYGYDSAGMRVFLRENTAGGTISSIFPTPAYSETTRTDGIVEHAVSVEVAGMPIATIRTVGTSTPEIFATHTDHLRSTRFVTSETTGQGMGATIVESTDYDAFGKITSHNQSGDFSERHKFTSHEFDASTSYTYAKARCLDTEVGRFVSEDPGSRDNPEQYLSDPQQLNSYAYARNNPVKFVDPNGESATLVLAAGGGIIGGGIALLNGGNWKSIASGFVNGATVGALAGSVIDTGGLSIPAVTTILTARGIADTGVDLIDATDKFLVHPDQFSREEKAGVAVELGFDAIGLIPAGRILTEYQKFSLDALTTTMDVLDEYFGEDVYKNINQKYQNSINFQQGSPLSSSPLSASGATGNINYSPSFADIRQQLNQISSILEQIRNSINNQQR